MAGSDIRTQDTTDPLVLLPSEIVLRILDYATPSSAAALTRLTRSWHAFIDQSHQDAIYSSLFRSCFPESIKHLSNINDASSFCKYFEDSQSWKDLCKRQTLLATGWNRESPITRESAIQVGNDPIWRFRPDFKRRIFLSTSQMGGMNVTDMDSGRLLWRLDSDNVRPFAHLEYQDGTAVWDREGNAVEVWKTDIEGEDLAKGEFKRVAVLNHDRQTRGFQLTGTTLCVVSCEKKGYVYDLSGETSLLREIDIEDGAVGHLDQGEHVVAYSLGNKGYHFFNKDNGESLGILHPKSATNTFHITHPKSQLDCHFGVGSDGRASDAFPPKFPRSSRTVPLELKHGGHPPRTGITREPLDDDEWGAGMLNGNMFAGVSRGGRVFACPDWREALKSDAKLKELTANIETDSCGSTFDLGGWLAVRDHKLMFEVRDRAYIVGLNDDNTLKTHDESPQRPSYAYATTSAAQLAVPVSFMGIYDDCVMTTYTASLPFPNSLTKLLSNPLPQTLRYRQRLEVEIGGLAQPRTRILPTKVIRILSFAPDPENHKNDENLAVAAEEEARLRGGDGERDESVVPETNMLRRNLSTLISLLVGEPELDEDMVLPMEGEEGEELGLREWLEGDEWEDEEARRAAADGGVDDELGDEWYDVVGGDGGGGGGGGGGRDLEELD